MGRPSIKLDTQILRHQRETKNYTQQALADELYLRLGKKERSSAETRKNDYQRIELKGGTSRQTAQALADIYGVSVRFLQGLEPPEPLEYIKNIVTLLNEQVQKSENEALRCKLESNENFLASPDKAIEELAENIGARIETCQLSRNPSEIAELKELTGLSEIDLLEPANVHGHWLIIINSSVCNRAEIVQGEDKLFKLITELVDEYLASSASDSSIRMLQDKPWCRMEIKRAGFTSRLMRIDFTRCHPFENKGIHWGTTWKDQFLLEDFKNWANSVANFVTSFDGVQAPRQLHQLRLIVTCNGLNEVDGEMKVITGHLDEVSEELMAAVQQEGRKHYLVQNWLKSDLKSFILPYLQKYPAECWDFHCVENNSIIIVSIPRNVQPQAFSDMSFYGHKYCLQLAEERGENQFDPVPWRIEDMEQLIKEIKSWIVSSSE